MIRPQVVSRLFVGREAELAALTEMLEGALQGRGDAAILGGDVGIGKSRLCREVKARAVAAGARVIEGRCSPAESTVPFGPFLDALRFRLRRGEREEATRVLEPVLAHVAPLFDELDSAAESGAPPTALPTPFEPILRVIRRLAEASPLVLLIEDAHWADPTSRDLLLHLARRLRAERVLLLVTVRTDELPPAHPVQRLIATVTRERVGRRIDLSPLTAAEVAAMVESINGAPPTAEFAEALWLRTEGNPLFVEELLSVLAEEHPDRFPELRPSDLAAVSIPATIQEAVLERIEPLGGQALQALSLAAVIGRSFRFEVLAAALKWPESRLLPVIETLVEHRMLEEDEIDRFQFRHGLVQEVLYTSAIGRRRRSWHRAVADAIERCAQQDEMPHHAISYHVREAGDMERARYHAVLAAEQAERLCAWRDAEALYEEAVHALEQEPDPPAGLEPELLERMAEAAWWQSRLSSSLQYLEEALALRRALPDATATARVLRRLAEVRVSQNHPFERALELLTEADRLLEGSRDTGEAALVANDVGRLRLELGEAKEAEASFEHGLATAHALGACHEEAVSMVGLGAVAITRGHVQIGAARLDLALDLLREHALPLTRASAAYGLGVRALVATRENERARLWLDAALEYARKLEAPAEEAIYIAYGAALDRRTGHLDRALVAAEEAAARLRQSRRREFGEALAILGDIYRLRGQHHAALSVLEEAARLGFGPARVTLAVVHLSEQQPEKAAAELGRVLEIRQPEERLARVLVLPVLVEARVRSGDVAGAVDALESLREDVAASDYRAGPASLLWAEGLVRCAQRRHEEARAALQQAAETYGSLDMSHEQARALLELAELELQADPEAHERVLRPARESLRIMEELRAGGDVDHARDVLRRAGVRVARAAPERPLGSQDDTPFSVLTPREHEVLRQLAKGHTNKHIARVLHIRPKTVANHVSNVLAKLDCATRTEAARLYLSIDDVAFDS